MLMWIILSSVFLAVFLLIRALFSKKITATAMYVLWILVAVRLLIPTYIPVEFELFSAQNTPSITYQVEAIEDSVSDYFAGQKVSNVSGDKIENTVLPSDAVVQSTADDNRNNIVQGNTSSDNAVINTTPGTTKFTDHPFLFIWILGILGFGCYFIITNIRFSMRLKRSRILLSEYDCKLPVYLVKWLPAPCMAGLARPTIYVNEQIYEVENPDYIIEHEYMHYRHKDMIWMLIQTILLCIHWFNPMVWLASYLFRKDCEFACDEAVAKALNTEERIAYGRTLLFFEATKGSKYSVFSTATSMSMDGKTMKRRVRAIVDTIPKKILSVVVACVLAVVLFAGSLIANTAEKNSVTENTWNATYNIDGTNVYYNFYPDGTTETTQSFTYEFRENNNEKIIDLYSDGEIYSSVVVQRANNGNIQLIPEINYFMDEESEFYIPLKDVTSEYILANGIDGITSNDLFNGTYHHTEFDSKIGVAGFQFYDDGTCKEFTRQTYQILNNHEIKIGKTTYQYLIKNDGDLLTLWTKEGEGTLNLVKVGLALSINVEVLEAGVFQDYGRCGTTTHTLENGESKSYIPVCLYYSLWIENNSINDLNDLKFVMVANEEFEAFLIDKKKISQKDLDEFYSTFDSVLQTLSGSVNSIGQLDSCSISHISFNYELADNKESLMQNGVLKAADDASNIKDIMDYVLDVTLIVYNEGKELTRVDLSTLTGATVSTNIYDEELEEPIIVITCE